MLTLWERTHKGKTMKKLLAVLSVMSGLFLGSLLMHPNPAQAIGVAISPKATYVLTYTTTASTISATASTLYEVTLASGAASEYVAFFDTNTATGGGGTAITALTNSAASGFKTRVFFSTTTANTQVKFDPPLIFFYGIQVVDSAATGQSMITWEPGVGSGQ